MEDFVNEFGERQIVLPLDSQTASLKLVCDGCRRIIHTERLPVGLQLHDGSPCPSPDCRYNNDGVLRACTCFPWENIHAKDCPAR